MSSLQQQQYKVYQNGMLASPSSKPKVEDGDLHVLLPSPAFSAPSQSTPVQQLGVFKKISGLAKYSFLPQGFPDSVHPNFKGYAGWFFLQNIMGNMVYGKEILYIESKFIQNLF